MIFFICMVANPSFCNVFGFNPFWKHIFQFDEWSGSYITNYWQQCGRGCVEKYTFPDVGHWRARVSESIMEYILPKFWGMTALKKSMWNVHIESTDIKRRRSRRITNTIIYMLFIYLQNAIRLMYFFFFLQLFYDILVIV